MIEPPQLTEVPAQAIAFIPLTIPREQIREVMEPGLKEIAQVLQQQNIKIAGPWFTYHLRMQPDVFDFQICIPTAAPVQPSGRVRAGERRAAKIARTVYHGPYEGLGDAWGEFMDWMKSQKLNPAADLWECYTAGPESSDDPANWRTELNRPLR
ncbi:MAG TPA: GyrI-like domain-containing protein [Verrucomicrobiaceae bacterium]|jgi:effector-binding domain-containing protein